MNSPFMGLKYSLQYEQMPPYCHEEYALMRLHIAAIALAILLLGGCSSKEDADYFSLSDSAHHPPAGMAQLVFYYPYSIFWLGVTANIEVGGYEVCGLKPGTFAIRNLAPNPETAINVSLCSTNGTAHLDIKTTANSKYYIRIVPNDQTVTGVYARHNLSGVKSLWDTSATTTPSAITPPPSGNKKPSANSVFWVDIIREPAALEEMQDLKICPDCL